MMTDSLLVRLNNSLLAAGNMTHTEFCHRTGIQWKKMQDFREGLPVSKHIRNKIARGINDLKPLIDPETAPTEVPAPAVQTELEGLLKAITELEDSMKAVDVPNASQAKDPQPPLEDVPEGPQKFMPTDGLSFYSESACGCYRKICTEHYENRSLSESDKRILTHLIFSGNISLEDKNRYVDFIYNQSA